MKSVHDKEEGPDHSPVLDTESSPDEAASGGEITRDLPTCHRYATNDYSHESKLYEARMWFKSILMKCPYRKPYWRPEKQIITAYDSAKIAINPREGEF